MANVIVRDFSTTRSLFIFWWPFRGVCVVLSLWFFFSFSTLAMCVSYGSFVIWRFYMNIYLVLSILLRFIFVSEFSTHALSIIYFALFIIFFFTGSLSMGLPLVVHRAEYFPLSYLWIYVFENRGTIMCSRTSLLPHKGVWVEAGSFWYWCGYVSDKWVSAS